MLTTFRCIYPRYILPEVLTHRMFSRNTSSSRAIPIKVMLKQIQESSWYPIWTVNQSGMSGEILKDPEEIRINNEYHDRAKAQAIEVAQSFANRKIHKQNTNRYLEPFLKISMVITTGEAGLQNFFTLRRAPDAMPEIQELANLMYDKYIDFPTNSEAKFHLPFTTDLERDIYRLDECAALTIARSSRETYQNTLGHVEISKEFKHVDKLWGDRHESPFEHAAMKLQGNHDNFKGWKSIRSFGGLEKFKKYLDKNRIM